MRAAWYDAPGRAKDVLEVGDLPRPDQRPGEVLVEVRASGINPSDYKRRGGTAPLTGRMIPHSDGAGVVRALGDGVDATWLGRRVWIWNAVNRYGYADPHPGEQGTAAEFVALPVEFVAPLPDATSFETGACLGVPAFTAYAALFADGPIDGATVLIQGGAGAVGELAVQWAAASGATAIATVSSPEKAGRALRSGAAHVIDYRTQDVIAEVERIAPRGVDRIVEVDFAANIGADARMVRPYGTIASYSSTSNAHPVVPYYELQFRAASIRTVQVFTMPAEMRADAVAAIIAGLEDGALRPTVAAAFPLDDIALAHETAERGAAGNIVLSL